jgi:hypothetical protein
VKRQHAYKVRAAYRLIADWQHHAIHAHPGMEHEASLRFLETVWFAELYSWPASIDRPRAARLSGNSMLEDPVEAVRKAIERWRHEREASDRAHELRGSVT